MKARYVRLAGGNRVIVPTENVEKYIREIGGPLRPPVKTKKAPEVENPDVTIIIKFDETVVVPVASPRQEQIENYLDAVADNYGGLLSFSLVMNPVGRLGEQFDSLKLTKKEQRRIARELSHVPVNERLDCRQVSSRANALEYYGNKEYGRSRDKRGDYRSNDFWSKQAHLCRTRSHHEKRDQRTVRMPVFNLLVSGEMPVSTLTVRKKYSGRQKYGYYD